MGAGASGLVGEGAVDPNRDTRIEANSKALWAQILNHAVDKNNSRNADENAEMSENRSIKEGSCKTCTYINDPLSKVCEMCGEVLPDDRPSIRTPTLKLILREATTLTFKIQNIKDSPNIHYKPSQSDDNDWIHVSSLNLNNEEIIINNLIPDTLYEIRCCYDEGEILDEIFKVRTGPHIPGPISSISASEIGSNFIMLNWSEPIILNGLPIEEYIVEYKLFGGQFVQCYKGIETVFVSNELLSQQIYVYRVASINALGQSPWSPSGAFRTKIQKTRRSNNINHTNHTNHTVVAAGGDGDSLDQNENDGEDGESSSDQSSMWISSIASNGRDFYYHPLTGQSCWTLPQGAILDVKSSFLRKRQRFLEELHMKSTIKLSEANDELLSQANNNNNNNGYQITPSFTRIKVLRSDIVNSSFKAFQSLNESDLLRPLRVIYIGEEGIDSGGMVKDWFIELSHALIKGEYGFFVSSMIDDNKEDIYRIDTRSSFIHNDDHHHSDSDSNLNSSLDLDSSKRSQLELFFEFIGKFLAKAILDHQLIDICLDDTVFIQLLRMPITMKELEKFDIHHYKGLKWILDNKIEGILDDMTFSIDIDIFGINKIIELKPNGANIKVNDNNKIEYVNLMIFYLISGSCLKQIESLISGFHKLIPISLLISNNINPNDLSQLLIGNQNTDGGDGSNSSLDISQIEAVSKYNGGYHETSEQIIWFWKCFKIFNLKNQKLLLRFITGLNKIPMDGFNPTFTITKLIYDEDNNNTINDNYSGAAAAEDTGNGGGERRTNRQTCLPRSHTCFNQLVLPPYDSYEELCEKIKFAIQNSSNEFLMT